MRNLRVGPARPPSSGAHGRQREEERRAVHARPETRSRDGPRVRGRDPRLRAWLVESVSGRNAGLRDAGAARRIRPRYRWLLERFPGRLRRTNAAAGNAAAADSEWA